MYYLVYALLIVIIASLLFFMLLQRKKYSSRLLKDEKMLLDIEDKCSFYINEYNFLKSMIRDAKFSSEHEKNKKFTGKTALVGDYFLPSYSNTKLILEDLGFDVDIAKTSQDVINKIKYGESYDIIFSNNIYGDGTGSECLKKLKEIKGFSIPVVIHTVTKDARNHFVNEVGFDAYIEKPVTKDNLVPILNKLFNM